MRVGVATKAMQSIRSSIRCSMPMEPFQRRNPFRTELPLFFCWYDRAQVKILAQSLGVNVSVDDISAESI